MNLIHNLFLGHHTFFTIKGIDIKIFWHVLLMLVIFAAISPEYFFVCLMVLVVIVYHELGHALTAKKYGVPVESIYIMILGGLANIDISKALIARQYFWITANGPLTNVAGAFVGSLVCLGLLLCGWPEDSLLVNGVIVFLAINITLMLMNLIPVYPLDGGRLIHAFFWMWWKNPTWAFDATTKVTFVSAPIAGITLIFFGYWIFGLIVLILAPLTIWAERKGMRNQKII